MDVIKEIIEAIVPNKIVRHAILVIIGLIMLGTFSVKVYAAAIDSDVVRINHQIQPMKMVIYENTEITEHIFEHFESQLPPGQRHNIEDLKAAAHKKMLDDEKFRRESGAGE